MPASHLLLHYGYFIVIVTLSQVSPQMLEKASKAAAAAVTKSNDNTLFSSLDSKSPHSLSLAVDMEKGAEPRQRDHGLEASNLLLTERSPPSSPGPDQKQSEDIRCPLLLAYDVCVSNFTLVNALILQIAQFTLAYFFAKSMSPYVSPGRPWQDRYWAGALPGIAIKNTFASLGACKRLYRAWAGESRSSQMAEKSGSSYLCWFRCFLYDPTYPSLADYLDMEQISVIIRKECAPVQAEKEGERKKKISTVRKRKNWGLSFGFPLKSSRML
jgi:hypothetical protein